MLIWASKQCNGRHVVRQTDNNYRYVLCALVCLLQCTGGHVVNLTYIPFTDLEQHHWMHVDTVSHYYNTSSTQNHIIM